MLSMQGYSITIVAITRAISVYPSTPQDTMQR